MAAEVVRACPMHIMTTVFNPFRLLPHHCMNLPQGKLTHMSCTKIELPGSHAAKACSWLQSFWFWQPSIYLSFPFLSLSPYTYHLAWQVPDCLESSLGQLSMTKHIAAVSCCTCCTLLVDLNIQGLVMSMAAPCRLRCKCCIFPGVIIKLEAML